MGLQVYHRKRKFDVTPEPRGRQARGKGNQYVIQKHAARRLHYDLRLELDGVMKSWAVTRGPSLVPGEKRLAVQVEDHPIEYNKFEGTIPQGEYGGGTVMIWDRGRWHPEGDPHKGLKKGHLAFTLEGEKLDGTWHLVRMRGRPNEKKASWLLIKAHDEAARERQGPGYPGGDAAVGGERPLDRGDRARQGQEAGVAFEPEREGQREGRERPGGTAARRRRRGARARAARAARASARRPRARPRPRNPGRRRAAAGLRAAVARDLAHRGAERCGLGARDQVRRLPHPGAARSRRGAAAHPQGPRLDRQIPQCGGRRRQAAGGDGADRRRDRGRGRARHLEFLDAAGRPQGRPARRLRLLRVRPAAPRRPRPARAAAHRAQGRAQAAHRRRKGRRQRDPLQRAFRRGRRAGAAAGLPHDARRHRVEARRCALPLRSGRDLHQDQVLERAGIRGRRLFALDRAAAGDRRARRSATTTMAG